MAESNDEIRAREAAAAAAAAAGNPGDEGGSGIRGKLEGVAGELLRRTLSSGLGGIQFTEESLRGVLKDVGGAPKELLTTIVTQSEKTRQEVVRVLAQEVRGYLSGLDLGRDLRKALSGMSIEVRTEIKFKDDGQGDVTTEVLNQVAATETGKRKRR